MSAPAIIVGDGVETRCDLERITKDLVERIPAAATTGLGSIVFRAARSLPRRERKRSTRSQGRKVFLQSSLGFYQPGSSSAPPYIEIYVDNLMRLLPPGLRGVRAIQELTVGHVLFHELGHHIHRTKRRRHADVEKEAEHWRRHLAGVAFDSRYWKRNRMATPMLFIAAASPGVVRLWGLEFVENNYWWAFILLPVLVPYALYLVLRRLGVIVRRNLRRPAAGGT